jgi:hypothetical protein
MYNTESNRAVNTKVGDDVKDWLKQMDFTDVIVTSNALNVSIALALKYI